MARHIKSPETKASIAAGLVAAIAASVCCVGPLLLLALGISGAWIGNLAVFEPYRPVLVVVTLLFFGRAFKTLYLAPKTCGPDSPCAARDAERRQRAAFWVLSAFTIGLLAFPSVAPLFL